MCPVSFLWDTAPFPSSESQVCSDWSGSSYIQTDRDQCLFWLVRHVPCAVLCLVAQSWPTLCDPIDCSPPGSSIHGILQARILEWNAISFSRRYVPVCIYYTGPHTEIYIICNFIIFLITMRNYVMKQHIRNCINLISTIRLFSNHVIFYDISLYVIFEENNVLQGKCYPENLPV